MDSRPVAFKVSRFQVPYNIRVDANLGKKSVGQAAVSVFVANLSSPSKAFLQQKARVAVKELNSLITT